ncbi:MAG: hypothetical protein JWN74_2271 [Acidobacteriaceae bacterium]|nr:hypothetical protein [Acidobacteriaceae bacterium]
MPVKAKAPSAGSGLAFRTMSVKFDDNRCDCSVKNLCSIRVTKEGEGSRTLVAEKPLECVTDIVQYPLATPSRRCLRGVDCIRRKWVRTSCAEIFLNECRFGKKSECGAHAQVTIPFMSSDKTKLFPEDGANFTPLNSSRCPLCGGQNASFGAGSLDGQHKIFQGWCPACTNLRITQEANDEVKRRNKGHLLSAALRRLPASQWKEEIGFAIELKNIDKLVSSVTELDVLDQFDAALKLICEMCPIVGQRSTFRYEDDWPLLTAKQPETALFILRQLAHMEYIEGDNAGNPHIPAQPTWKAYERLQQIQASGKNSQIGFVAMSFQLGQDAVWQNVMEPGIGDAGYMAVRVDKYEHSNRIDDEIIAQIRRCRFLVADFTLQRNGVYFEAGFAQGLGRHVIFMCHESDKDNLHFDTRQFNHIFYDDLDKARAALTHRIVAQEGEGTLKASARTAKG